MTRKISLEKCMIHALSATSSPFIDKLVTYMFDFKALWTRNVSINEITRELPKAPPTCILNLTGFPMQESSDGGF